MSETTQWTIRTAVVSAALLAAVWLIVLAVRFQVASIDEVQKTCIEQGGSWIAGQCIQLDGGAS
jgi:hypothetical protein